jgi:glycine cleavage system H lipoate-binding protein
MKRIESELEKKCSQYARERGWASVKLEKNWNKGVPDRLFVKNDKVFFVEFKKDSKQILTKEQIFWCEFTKPIHFVISNFEDFKEIVFFKD